LVLPEEEHRVRVVIGILPRARAFAVVGTGFVLALASAQPTLGYTQLSVTGTVGPRSMTDNQTYTGAVCGYKFDTGQGAWKLRRIDVNSPQIKAAAGQGAEQVGWNFTVQRREGGVVGNTTWQDRYTSPMVKATTDQTHNANFGAASAGVKVVVPFAYGTGNAASYRVLVKFVWYKVNGTSVLGTVKGRVDWYAGMSVTHYSCPDYG
jgi:hypothetical protein